MKKGCFIVSVLFSLAIHAQKTGLPDSLNTKHSFDIQCLGNKGFASLGYNFRYFKTGRFSFWAGPSIGYVPSSSEDTAHTIPRFLHLNIGTAITCSWSTIKFLSGISYTKILLGDPYHKRPKSNYNRLLGDFGLIKEFRGQNLGIKLTYTPMFYDDGADDVEDLPIAFTFRIRL